MLCSRVYTTLALTPHYSAKHVQGEKDIQMHYTAKVLACLPFHAYINIQFLAHTV